MVQLLNTEIGKVLAMPETRRRAEEAGTTVETMSPAQLGGLLQRILDSTLSNAIARQVFDALWNGASDADTVIEAKGLRQVSDSGAIAALVEAKPHLKARSFAPGGAAQGAKNATSGGVDLLGMLRANA